MERPPRLHLLVCCVDNDRVRPHHRRLRNAHQPQCDARKLSAQVQRADRSAASAFDHECVRRRMEWRRGRTSRASRSIRSWWYASETKRRGRFYRTHRPGIARAPVSSALIFIISRLLKGKSCLIYTLDNLWTLLCTCAVRRFDRQRQLHALHADQLVCGRPKRVYPYHIWLPFDKYTRYYGVSAHILLSWKSSYGLSFHSQTLKSIAARSQLNFAIDSGDFCAEFSGRHHDGVHHTAHWPAGDEFHAIHSISIRCDWTWFGNGNGFIYPPWSGQPLYYGIFVHLGIYLAGFAWECGAWASLSWSPG